MTDTREHHIINVHMTTLYLCLGVTADNGHNLVRETLDGMIDSQIQMLFSDIVRYIVKLGKLLKKIYPDKRRNSIKLFRCR